MILNRIGTDMTIEWPITIDGVEEDLSQLDLTVYVIHNRFKKEMEFTTENNTITFTFAGVDQKVLGTYDLMLVMNEGESGQVICDAKEAFKLYE